MTHVTTAVTTNGNRGGFESAMTATEQLANQWSTDGQFSFMDYLSRETMDAYRKEAEGVFSDRQRKGVRAAEVVKADEASGSYAAIS